LVKGKKYRIFNWAKNCNQLLSLLKHTDIAIVDSYLAKSSLYKHISKNVPLAVYIDDYKRINYPRGIVVNGAAEAEKINYPKNAGTRYLLGVKYAFIRKEFWGIPPEKKIFRNIKNILITFGGGDLLNVTSKVLRFVNYKYPDLIKKVIIGKTFRNARGMIKAKDSKIEFLRSLSTQEMKKNMLIADIAISAGGQTLFELARLGVPTIGICCAHNQLLNLTGFTRRGFIKFAGWYNEKTVFNKIEECLDASTYINRLKMSRVGKKLVDGLGPRRVVRFILSNKMKKQAITLRNATEGDCRDLWLWRNSPEARKGSFNSKSVLWCNHKRWLESVLTDKKVVIYIAEQKDKKLGVIRFEIKDKFLTVSVNLNPAFFGKGLGSQIIKFGSIKSLLEYPKVKRVMAEVISDNVASQKAFEKAGYVFVRKTKKNGKEVDIFEFRESERVADVF